MIYDKIVSILTLLAAFGALYISINTAQNADIINGQGQLSSQIIAYQKSFSELLEVEKTPWGIRNYIGMDAEERTKVQIVAGMLVGVVDLMYTTGDRRAMLWKDYIGQVEGPLACGYPLEIYARTDFVVEAIKSAETKAKNEMIESKIPSSDCHGV